MNTPETLKMPSLSGLGKNHKVFYEIKVYVVSLVLSFVSKTDFGILLAHLVCLKS
jgi:hypothetical protein